MGKPDYTDMQSIEGVMHRALVVNREGVDVEARTVELSFSSEEPVERFFGMEILDHKRTSVDLSRINQGGAVLVDHFSDQAGVVERAWVDTKDRKGRATLRFSKSEFGESIFNDIVDGIRKNVSVGYRVHKMVLDKEEEGVQSFRAMRWEPWEISIVAIPADISVGVGRGYSEAVKQAGAGRHENAPLIVHFQNREGAMPTESKEEVITQEVRKQPTINLDEVRNEAVKKEQDRVKELLALGSQHKCETEAREFVSEGKQPEALKMLILERYKDIKPTEQVDATIGLTKKERREFSFVRMINALGAKDWGLAPFEHECSRAVAKTLGRDPQGMFIPEDVLKVSMAEDVDSRSQMEMILRSLNALLSKRELTVGTAATAGNLVATNLMSQNFIDLLRNSQVLPAIGAQVLSGLMGDVTFPRQDGGASAGWVAESGNVANSELTTDLPTLTPHSMGAYSDMTRKLLLQSDPSVEMLVRADLAMAVALERDSAGLNGTGAGDIPRGIRATTGIGDVDHGTDGGSETWTLIVGYESGVGVGNAAVGDMWYVMNAKAFGSAKVIPKVAAQAIYLASGRQAPLGQAECNGYPVAVTNQLPSNLVKGTSGAVCSATVFGNFRDLLIGEWSGLDMLVDPYTLGLDGGLRVIVHQDIDFLIRHAASFSASDDVITT